MKAVIEKQIQVIRDRVEIQNQYLNPSAADCDSDAEYRGALLLHDAALQFNEESSARIDRLNVMLERVQNGKA